MCGEWYMWSGGGDRRGYVCVCVAQGLRAVCKYTIQTHIHTHTYIHTIQLQPPQKKAKRYMYVNCIYIIYMSTYLYVHCAYSCTHNFVDEYIYSVIIISYSAQVTQTTPKQNTGTCT